MQFIHSNKQYIERSMYPINPYMSTPSIKYPDVYRFACPDDFNFNENTIDIINLYAQYQNANKKYIVLISDSAISTEIGSYSGRTYAYSENGGSYTITSNGSPIPWTTGSTKRHIIVIDTHSSIIARIPANTIWCFMGAGVYSLTANNASTLNYLHLESPTTFTSLPDYCLNSAALIGQLSIPTGVSLIGNNALSYCQNLTGTLKIPNSVVTLSPYCFQRNINMIGDIDIPESVTAIGVGCFYDCSGFNGLIKLPTTLLSIGNEAFYNCNKIHGDLIIPDSVTAYGSYCFAYCAGLNGIVRLSNNATVVKDSMFYGCKFIGDLVIPNGVTNIQFDAFRECKQFKGTLTLPESLTTMGNNCFFGPAFTRINAHMVTPPTMNEYAIVVSTNTTICPLHVPVGSLAAYQAAQYWNEFTNIIDDL